MFTIEKQRFLEPDSIYTDKRLTPSARVVLLYALTNPYPEGFCIDKFSEDLGISLTNLEKCFKELKRNFFLRIYKKFNKDGDLVRVYSFSYSEE